MKKLLPVAILIALTGCAIVAIQPKVTYTPEVRRQSATSEPSFQSLLTAMGGVGYADRAAFLHPKERTLVRIEVVLRYDDQKTGIERWTIRHDTNDSTVYQVLLVPDGQGTTDFTVSKAP